MTEEISIGNRKVIEALAENIVEFAERVNCPLWLALEIMTSAYDAKAAELDKG